MLAFLNASPSGNPPRLWDLQEIEEGLIKTKSIKKKTISPISPIYFILIVRPYGGRLEWATNELERNRDIGSPPKIEISLNKNKKGPKDQPAS